MDNPGLMADTQQDQDIIFSKALSLGIGHTQYH
jgi:hypothetical protein